MAGRDNQAVLMIIEVSEEICNLYDDKNKNILKQQPISSTMKIMNWCGHRSQCALFLLPFLHFAIKRADMKTHKTKKNAQIYLRLINWFSHIIDDFKINT